MNNLKVSARVFLLFLDAWLSGNLMESLIYNKNKLEKESREERGICFGNKVTRCLVRGHLLTMETLRQ